MSRRFLRSVMVVATLLLLLSMMALPTSAAPRQLPGSAPHNGTRNVPSPALLGISGIHYLYVEDGTNPDIIDVYKIDQALTHIGQHQTDANNGGSMPIGTQAIAISEKDQAHGNCLLLLDRNGGYVDSFTIYRNGLLSDKISHLSYTAGYLRDLHVAGDIAYVNSIANYSRTDFATYAIGAGCALTFLHQYTYSGLFYSNFALGGSTELVAPDNNTGNIDVYTLGSGGTITYLASTRGKINSPDGIVVQIAYTKQGPVTDVFTGQDVGGARSAQGGQLNVQTGAISFLKGSPAGDPNGNLAIAETFDRLDHLLIQGETTTYAMGVYRVTAGIPGTPGSIHFLEHTPLANNSYLPEDFAQLGQVLFVLGAYYGDLEACTLSQTGVSGCATAGVVTNPSGLASGLVIL